MYLKQESILPLLLNEYSIGRNLSMVAADYIWIFVLVEKSKIVPTS